MKWEKPNGVIIETNDTQASIEKAKELGWKEVKQRKTRKKATNDNSNSNS